MITDRTQADVDNAKKIREEKVKMFKTLTSSDINTLERGMMTINTLNRIESKQVELTIYINSLGYWNISIYNKTNWTYEDFFLKQDFQRIIDNMNILRSGFFTYLNTPNTPNISFYYQDINALEKILVDLELMIDEIKSRHKRCGTFRCGQKE